MIIADILKSEQMLDPLSVKSATSYIILGHLLRNLIIVDEHLQLNGDLAESWKINSEQTLFSFQLKKQQKFSDGTIITAQTIKDTISRQQKNNKAIHFNFSSIKEVIAQKNNLTIKLTHRNPHFLYQLHHPEFGVLHPDDSSAPIGQITFHKSSGPYTLYDKTNKFLILNKNIHFQGEYPDTLKFIFNDNEAKFSNLINGHADFIFPHSISEEHFNYFKSSKDFAITQPHIGFTYWISINPQSPLNKIKVQRQFLQRSLKLNKQDIPKYLVTWSPADQLYLPDGFGRVPKEKIQNMWQQIFTEKSSIKKIEHISILIANNFDLKEIVLEKLKKISNSLDITTYETQEDFSQFLEKNPSFDLIQTNNDFSSSELMENINVALNPRRPLIMLPHDSPIKNLLKNASQSQTQEEKGRFIQNIEYELLNEAFIVPLAYNHIYFIHKKNLDLTRWSKLFPEIAFWKSKFY